MAKSLNRFRFAAFARQAGRCSYYDLPMWTKDPHSFAERFGITHRQARLLQCTAEH